MLPGGITGLRGVKLVTDPALVEEDCAVIEEGGLTPFAGNEIPYCSLTINSGLWRDDLLIPMQIWHRDVQAAQ